MINIPKNLVKSVADGTEQPILLETFIMNNFSISDIIKSFAELLVSNEIYSRPIAVSQEEYDAITSLFKVKGQRILEDGTITEEKRGRKRKGEQ